MIKFFMTNFWVFTYMVSFQFATAQMSRIDNTISQIEAESHLRFLAADELKGRNTGTDELNIAARYIAEQFRKFGLEPIGDAEGDYLQRVHLTTSFPPSEASIEIADMSFNYGEDMAFVGGDNGEVEGQVVYMTDVNQYGDYDLKGKVVAVVLRDLRGAMSNIDRVRNLQDAGAVGLVELFDAGQQFPWPLVMNYLHSQKMSAEDPSYEKSLPHLWVRDTTQVLLRKLKESSNEKALIQISGLQKLPVNTFNVIGRIEGSDPELKKEHIVMCAHYDHVGIQQSEDPDSIYNGTRDNGIGTTGLINAAQYFGKYPPKRSIIVIALTGEEKGLLGSQYYTNHPKIPLEETVFALNIDNSGYTTTDVITLLDTNRTNIDELVYQAASEVGLGVIGDRLPGQNYYERSDQVSFASKGVPAINFKMSMTAFDERISKYYHRPSDEINTVDLDYIYKYWRAYIRTAELIGNWNKRPYWIPGDKFEPAGNALYKK